MALRDNVKHRKIYCGSDCNAAGRASDLKPAGCFWYWRRFCGELRGGYTPVVVKPEDGVGGMDEG